MASLRVQPHDSPRQTSGLAVRAWKRAQPCSPQAHGGVDAGSRSPAVLAKSPSMPIRCGEPATVRTDGISILVLRCRSEASWIGRHALRRLPEDLDLDDGQGTKRSADLRSGLDRVGIGRTVRHQRVEVANQRAKIRRRRGMQQSGRRWAAHASLGDSPGGNRRLTSCPCRLHAR